MPSASGLGKIRLVTATCPAAPNASTEDESTYTRRVTRPPVGFIGAMVRPVKYCVKSLRPDAERSTNNSCASASYPTVVCWASSVRSRKPISVAVPRVISASIS